MSVYLGYSLLNIPKILTKFIPLSFLISLVLAILKFENENELIILWTAGLNKIKLVKFFVKISLIVMVLQIVFASIINPNILNYSRTLIKSSNLDYISSMIKTNQFNDTVPGLTIFVEEKNSNGDMKNILIRDESKILKSIDNVNNTENITIIAKKGRVVNPSSPALVLSDGIIQSQNINKNIQTIKFKKTVLKLNNLQTRSIVQTKIQETPSILLIKCYFNKKEIEIINCPKDHKKNDVLSEINRRFGIPLYIPIITLIICFLLNQRGESKYKNYFKYIYTIIAFSILVIAEILVKYSGKSFYNSLIYYLTPFFSFTINLFRNYKKFLI